MSITTNSVRNGCNFSDFCWLGQGRYQPSLSRCINFPDATPVGDGVFPNQFRVAESGFPPTEVETDSVIQITGVRLTSTTDGVEVMLETAEGEVVTRLQRWWEMP